VHPPLGQVTSHALLPWQVTVPPWPSESLHVLVPSHVTVPFSPTVRVHELPPAQLDVQPEPHVPEHCDCPAQVEVQPVPQSRLHVFLDEQLNEALLGTPLAAEPLSAPEPNAHIPPDAQLHVVPLQEHEPLQSSGVVVEPEHEAKRTTRGTAESIPLSMRGRRAALMPETGGHVVARNRLRSSTLQGTGHPTDQLCESESDRRRGIAGS
jgi:hypothetical protein